MPAVIGLDHVQVAAPREEGVEERVRAFYGELLGLREIEKPQALQANGGVWFSLGMSVAGAEAGAELHIGLDDPFSPARKAHPALLVDDLAAMRRLLERVGVAVSDAEEIPGVRRFYVADPFGNRIELVERV